MWNLGKALIWKHGRTENYLEQVKSFNKVIDKSYKLTPIKEQFRNI